jgi:D-alanyl-D-alanine carboxypeptidase/D-alanyl-D-alanine-endopeptidase (penicillin-binding protein 4)
VRAKSGTLERVIALSGYVLSSAGRRPLAFSFIAEGVSGKHAEARDQLDRAVEALAAALAVR